MTQYIEDEGDGNLIDLINSRIDDEIQSLRDLSGESEATDEEIYQLAKRNVKRSLSQAIARL